MERPRILLLLGILPALLLALPACGGSETDPATVLDRALTREKLSHFAAGPEGPGAGVVSVQALGHEDRVLEERQVPAAPGVMDGIREALGASTGLRGLAENLVYEGGSTVGGEEADHVSGGLDPSGLARALAEAGAGELDSLAGIEGKPGLEETLAAADFDLYAGRDDGVIRRLDLTLALDDPDNALPPTRIRFSLTPVPSDA